MRFVCEWEHIDLVGNHGTKAMCLYCDRTVIYGRGFGTLSYNDVCDCQARERGRRSVEVTA